MITCERCNTNNLEGSQYCDECGALLAAAPSRGRKPQTNPAAEGVMQASPAESDGGPSPASDGGSGAASRSNVEAEPSPMRSAAAASAAAASSAPGAGSQKSVPRAGGPHAKLVIHRGRSAGKEFPMNEEEAQIGRWDADGGIFPDIDLDADDPEAKVSRRHARITRRGEQYFIEDLGSTNGTFINRGRRLLPGDRQPLNDGDEVIVGKTFLRFEVIKH